MKPWAGDRKIGTMYSCGLVMRSMMRASDREEPHGEYPVLVKSRTGGDGAGTSE